jgi:hypothetical protein
MAHNGAHAYRYDERPPRTRMKIRPVPLARGWHWFAEGVALFKKAPVNWLLMIGVLLVVAKLILLIPYVGLVVLLFFPVVLVGLMEGCRAVEYGKELKFGYLLSGCVRHTAALVILGGIGLAGNALTMMLLLALGGDSIAAVMKFAAQNKVTPENVHEIREAASQAFSAIVLSWALSIPLLMALWFAPLLVYFNHLKPLAAMLHSLWACWKNLGAFLLYGAVLMTIMILATPLAAATGILDFALWLAAPVIVPSIYAAYKDIFDIDESTVAQTPPPPAPPDNDNERGS